MGRMGEKGKDSDTEVKNEKTQKKEIHNVRMTQSRKERVTGMRQNRI